MSSDSEAIMLPEILRMLEGMRQASTHEPLFHRVESYNRYEDAAKNQQNVRRLLARYTGTQYIPPDLQPFARRLERSDYFLTIRINRLVELIELQFAFYKRFVGPPSWDVSKRAQERQDEVDGVRPLPVQNPVPERSLSLFIDPRRRDYLSELKDAISRMFPEANLPPYAVVTLNGKATDSATVYYLPQDSVLRLDGSESTDPDTPRARFRYRWRQIEPGEPINIPPARSLGLDAADTALVQTLVPRWAGRYQVGLVVCDQVTVSREAVVQVEVISTPVLSVSPTHISVPRRLSLRDLVAGLRERTTRSEKYSFRATFVDTSTSADSVCIESREDPARRCFAFHADTSVAKGPFSARPDTGGLLITASTKTRTSPKPLRSDITVRPWRHGIQGPPQSVTIDEVVSSMVEYGQQFEFYALNRDLTVAGKRSTISAGALTHAVQVDLFLYDNLGMFLRFNFPASLTDTLGFRHLSMVSPGMVWRLAGDRVRPVVRVRGFRASLSDSAGRPQEHSFWGLGLDLHVSVVRPLSLCSGFEYFESFAPRVGSGLALSLGAAVDLGRVLSIR